MESTPRGAQGSLGQRDVGRSGDVVWSAETWPHADGAAAERGGGWEVRRAAAAWDAEREARRDRLAHHDVGGVYAWCESAARVWGKLREETDEQRALTARMRAAFDDFRAAPPPRRKDEVEDC